MIHALIHSDLPLVPWWWQKRPFNLQLPLQLHSKAPAAESEFFTLLSCWLSPEHCLKIADCSLTCLNSMRCSMRWVLAPWRPSPTDRPFLAGGAWDPWVINCCSIGLLFLIKTQDKHACETAVHSLQAQHAHANKEHLLFKGIMFGSWYQRATPAPRLSETTPKPLSW